MNSDAEIDGTVRPETLLADLQRLQSSRCRDCATPLCEHQILISIVLGFKDAPRCFTCLAQGLEKTAGDLRNHTYLYIQRRECWHTGWKWANIQKGFPESATPAELWPDTMPATCATALPKESTVKQFDAEFNAGGMGCGDLVLELRIKLNALKPKQVLKLTAEDPGAPADIPAWCGLTGHTLVSQQHPVYIIQRKE